MFGFLMGYHTGRCSPFPRRRPRPMAALFWLLVPSAPSSPHRVGDARLQWPGRGSACTLACHGRLRLGQELCSQRDSLARPTLGRA